MEALPNKINVRINEGASCVETRNVCNPEKEEILLKSRKRKLIARKKHTAIVTRIFFSHCNKSP
jgi:hypothetical protein